MSNVTFEDHSEQFMASLMSRVRNACGAAASRLADEFREGLQENQAPPHSAVGDIPHKYNGWRPGGFDDPRRLGVKNNAPETGFSAIQSDYLSNYIEPSVSGNGAVVGFSKRGSHVTDRFQNYLLRWDAGMEIQPKPEAVERARRNKKRIPKASFGARPWVMPIYRRAKQQMIADAVDAFMMPLGGSGDVPF